MKYIVKVNGAEVPVQPVRVSALPLNRVWDGNQRPVEQTEEAYFVSFDLTGTATLDVEVPGGFSSYEVRPKAFRLGDRRSGNAVTLTVDRPMQFTFEPDGSHHALHIFVNPPVQKPAGDVLYFGPGQHKADLIWLESGQTLYIDEGAVVQGVVYARNAENIRILGRGVLDSAPYRRGNDEHEGGREVVDALRQRGVCDLDVRYCGNMVLSHCKNVLVEGIILKDSPMWTLIVRNDCENVVIDNVKLIGQWRYNSDGFDICTSKNVTVKNSFVRSFDDCFVARGAYLEGETGNVENLSVENCVFWCDWGKTVEFWCGHKPTAIRDIRMENCYFVHLSASALNISTWFGSGDSTVENVVLRDLYIDGDPEYANLVVETPRSIGYKPESGFIPHLLHASVEKLGVLQGLGQTCTPVEDYSVFRIRYRNILLDNIHCDDPRLKVCVRQLADGVLTIEDIRAENCDFQIDIETADPKNGLHAATAG